MPVFLSCDKLHKRFGDFTALHEVSFELEAGKCLVLLGPSGCGKTTLLNIIAGILGADGGSLHCDGITLDQPETHTRVPMRQRGFAMVFQDFSLWPHLTVAENVAFGLRVLGVSRADRERRVREALAQVSMESYADRHPSLLSGGQQQRVSIARALVVRPRLLLLDEPLSALDAKLRESLKHEIANLLRETGITAVYVTHDQMEAFTVGHTIALMNAGRIEQMDAPETIYAAPQTRFTADFIGASNILPFRLHQGTYLIGQSTRLACPLNVPNSTTSGHIAVRREAVRVQAGNNLGKRNPPPGGLVIPGFCRSRHFLGDRHEVQVEVEPDLIIRAYAEPVFQPGDPVDLILEAEGLRFLAS